MKFRSAVCMLTVLVVLLGFSAGHATVELVSLKTLNLDSPPLDMAVSTNGKMIFILTDQHELLIQSTDGTVNEKVSVDAAVDGIEVGPREDILFLTSRRSKTIDVVSLDFIRPVNVDGSPFKGPADAPVVVAVFSDFQCPYCSRLVHVLDQVVEKYPETVKLVFKHYPIRSHKYAQKAALATMAADRQGKFWEFHDRLFENYKKLNDEMIDQVAADLGLDVAAFEKDLKDPALQKQLTRDIRDAQIAGVRGTPSIFVNGRKVRNRTLKGFETDIEKALGNLDETASGNASPAGN